MKLLNFIILLVAYLLTISVVTSEEVTLTAGPVTCDYKNKDTSDDYSSPNATIKCSDSTCTVSGSGATASDGLLNINAAGTYVIQGSLNGQVKIEVTKEDFVHLVLNGVIITSNDGPAIYGVTADKITMTLVGDNTLTDSSNYTNLVDEEPDACLFTDSDLSINGTGSLSVTGKYGDAIRCKKDLKIVSGNITVPSAVQRGIKAKNSICIKDGTIDINSTNTAIKVTKDDDAGKGYIVIDGGNVAISTEKDGIHAETHLTIRGGYVNVKKCAEGIEGQMIDIIGGEVHVLASDDGINASKISTTDTNNTTSNMKRNPEGKPGGNPGGNPGDNQQSTGTDGSVYINIVGGKTYVTVSGNDADGIDSNGVLYIGGNAEVYTSIEGGDVYGNMAALDAEGTNAIVEGATVIVTASNSGGGGKMGGRNKRQGPQGDHGNMGGMNGMGGMGETGSIYQPYIQISVNSQTVNTKIEVKDSSNNVIGTFTPDVSYSTVLFTSPSMKAGESYTVVTGNDSVVVSATEAATGSVNAPSVTSPDQVLESSSDGFKVQPKLTAFLILILSFILLN